ncbi:MAG TPA: hypothetical protein VGM88_32975 [Kofleriaceae bacterium]
MRACAVLLGLAALVRVADAAPDDLVAEPIVLAPGTFDVRLAIEARLETRSWLRPLSLSPDAYYGVTARLTIGLTHSDASLDRIDAGDTFCVRTEVPGGASPCRDVYRGSNVDVRYLALRGPTGQWSLAAHARFLIRDVDPFKPAVTLGALARWTRGRFAIWTDPYLQLGLANRDRGNRAAVSVPIFLALQPARRWELWLHTGFDTDVAVWRDGNHAPLALGAAHAIRGPWRASLEVGWEELYGAQHDYKAATAIATIEWRD